MQITDKMLHKRIQNYFKFGLIWVHIIGPFHWGCLVSNYGFLEGWKECLQSRLGSVIVSRLDAVD